MVLLLKGEAAGRLGLQRTSRTWSFELYRDPDTRIAPTRKEIMRTGRCRVRLNSDSGKKVTLTCGPGSSARQRGERRGLLPLVLVG